MEHPTSRCHLRTNSARIDDDRDTQYRERWLLWESHCQWGAPGWPAGVEIPSPAIPALVVISLAIVSGLLVWWFMKKLRRSRRYAPVMALAELNNDRPVLWEVEVGQAITATKIHQTGWNRLQPMMVSYAPDIDPEYSSSNNFSSMSTSDRSPRPSPPFSIFSPIRKPDIRMAPTTMPRDVTVAVLISMPSEHRSVAGGELCLGVTHTPV
ncbi:hypothetical protein ONZ51_g10055 [Trametes cubensis]|uniref:Uncharacterized protein n=1 Tax=Trametes cubensis TaxID=1111947 RepID=A0AAD7TK69_9APHY|nr:hypothetical protein ONZ51_g10055 [Trametes cubensis]